MNEDGKIIAEHRKSNDGRWSYRHKLSHREIERGECAEHGGDGVAKGSLWCGKKPAVLGELLWNMPGLTGALASGHDVLWCAGEKDAERVQDVLDSAGSKAIATCVHQGENSPVTDAQAKLFEGFAGRVLLYFDHDLTGMKHALDRYGRLKEAGVRVRIRGWGKEGELASGGAKPGDISDYLDRNNSLKDCRTIPVRELKAEVKAALAEARAAKEGSSSASGVALAGSGKAKAKGGDGGHLLEAFRAALGKAGCREAGEKHSCPHPGHEDANPSFGVAEGARGGLVLACSCPGGMARGEEHTAWVKEILEALGLGWEAVSGKKAGEGEGAGDEYARNDTGNAEILRDLHGPDILHIRGTDRLLAWDGKRWAEDDQRIHAMCMDVVARRFELARECRDPKLAGMMRQFAVSCGNGARIREMVRGAAYIGRSAGENSVDAARHLLPVANGTLELADHGINLREHRREDQFTRMVPVSYKEGARSEAWDEFLDRFVPEREERAWLQRICGYMLLGWNKDRIILVISGPTSTGKTTFLNILLDTLGSGFAGTFQLSMFRTRRDDAPRPDILKSMPRRLIVAEEGSTEWKLHADTIKSLTSGGKIEARGMRSNDFTERTPAFVPVIATNEYPVVQYADAATKRRLFAFPFSQQVRQGEEDAGFRARLGSRDREAVLAWLCEGYEDYARDQAIGDPPGAARIATETLRQSLNPIDQFISECCETDLSYRTTPAVLFDSYSSWYEAEGLRASDKPTQTAFGRHLTDSGYLLHDTEYSSGMRKSVRYRYGIRLARESG